MDFFLMKLVASLMLTTVPVFPQTLDSESVELVQISDTNFTNSVIQPIDTAQLDEIAKEKAARLEAERVAREEAQRIETAKREALHLPLPVGAYSYSSDFGPRCNAGIATGAHLGIDLAAAYGTPIYSITAGEVVKVVDGSGSIGGTVIVRSTINGEQVEILYHHMEVSSKYVSVGDKVEAGQQISDVASTGLSTGPHLHLEIWKNGGYRVGDGTAVDPADYFNSIGLAVIESATSQNAGGNECSTETAVENEGTQ